MYIKAVTVVLVIGLISCMQISASAISMPYSKSLSEAISQSDVIIAARLVSYVPEQNYTHSLQGLLYAHMGVLRPPGHYSFEVLNTLKGKSTAKLNSDLPVILSLYYNDEKLMINDGSQVLLVLKPNVSGQLAPLDPTLPMIPITQEAVDSIQRTDDVQSQVLNLMLASAADPALRQTETYLLRNVVDPQVVAGLAPYLNDPNVETRSNVLYCMAENQQVSVIPRIAALEREIEKRGNGTSADTVVTLGDFTTPDAVPYLNPLLFEATYYTRLNTMFSLGKIADQTSAPYLILALRDPDPQKIIPSGAWGLLHRIVLALKRPPQDSDTFYRNREAETKILYDWWNDELNGKHIPNTPEGKKLLNYTLPDGVPVAALNTLLFQPVRTVREETISRLRKQANTSSIPYLVLALQDPDTTVAYQAYKILHRLIPTLGTGQSAAAFTANRDAATQPLYAWWNDELLGKHLPKPPVS